MVSHRKLQEGVEELGEGLIWETLFLSDTPSISHVSDSLITHDSITSFRYSQSSRSLFQVKLKRKAGSASDAGLNPKTRGWIDANSPGNVRDIILRSSVRIRDPRRLLRETFPARLIALPWRSNWNARTDAPRDFRRAATRRKEGGNQIYDKKSKLW